MNVEVEKVRSHECRSWLCRSWMTRKSLGFSETCFLTLKMGHHYMAFFTELFSGQEKHAR